VQVSVTELRARLAPGLDGVRDGDEIVVAERGFPARIVGVGGDRRPGERHARGRPAGRGATARRLVSDFVSEQRR